MVARYPSWASLDGSGLPGIHLGPLLMGVWVARYPYFSAQLSVSSFLLSRLLLLRLMSFDAVHWVGYYRNQTCVSPANALTWVVARGGW